MRPLFPKIGGSRMHPTFDLAPATNNSVQTPRFNQALAKLLGIRGGTIGSSVSPDLVPVILVADITTGPQEQDYPRAAMGRTQLTAIIFPTYALGTQLGSPDLRVTIEKVIFSASVACEIVGVIQLSGLGAPVGAGEKTFRDTRRDGEPQARLSTRDAALVFAGNQVFGCRLQANTPFTLLPDLVIKPNFEFALQSQTAGCSVSATWFWREEPLRG